MMAKAKVTDGEWVDETLGQEESDEKPKKAKKKAPAKKAVKKGE
jgi:hypothetical protein